MHRVSIRLFHLRHLSPVPHFQSAAAGAIGGGTLFSVSRSIRRASRCLYESHGLLICLMLFRDRGPGSANELPFSVLFSLCFSGQGFSFP